SDRPDLVILDVMMPEMNGYDVCVVMKADSDLSRIPVVLLTGVDKTFFKTVYTKHMGLMTEADDYIAKPVDPEELARRIASFFDKD
ncbi:MAG: response regulator, partial [Deltaproteobacteria bacterium]|nr:response regulator [Deltaproteobacteria bacterium]